MNLKLLFDIKINDNLEENWLKFKNETTLLYSYYYEISKEECITIFKLVRKLLADEMVNNKNDELTLKTIRSIQRDLRSHLEFLEGADSFGRHI